MFFSNGEMWLGLEYMYYVQKSHGEGGTKLCSYIAADRTTYQYVCYDKFAISNWQDDYKIREIGPELIYLHNYEIRAIQSLWSFLYSREKYFSKYRRIRH